MELTNTKLIAGIFILLAAVGAIGATLYSFDVKDYIINNFQNVFNIETNPVIEEINIEGEEYWNIEYLNYEEGIKAYIQPLNETILEIRLENNNTEGYKFQSVICNITNVNTIEKFEYNPNTEVWASTGSLQYQDLQYTHPEGWCSETNGYGFVLFASGSKDRIFRLKFSEGEKRIILITGSGSEKVDISYSEGNVAFVNFTADEVGRKNDDTITMVTNVGNLR